MTIIICLNGDLVKPIDQIPQSEHLMILDNGIVYSTSSNVPLNFVDPNLGQTLFWEMLDNPFSIVFSTIGLDYIGFKLLIGDVDVQEQNCSDSETSESAH